jgi:hypothetical protein
MFVGNLCIDSLTINIIDWLKIIIVDFLKCWEYIMLTRWKYLCWTVDNIVCWVADNIFWNSVYHPLNYSITYPFIQALIQTFNFHSSLQMNCWHVCWKSISSANEIIKSIPFLNCLRLAHAVLHCLITIYSSVQKRKLLLPCLEGRKINMLSVQLIKLIVFALSKWQVVFWAAWNSFSCSKWLALSGGKSPAEVGAFKE